MTASAAFPAFMETRGMSHSGHTQTQGLILYKISVNDGRRPKEEVQHFGLKVRNCVAKRRNSQKIDLSPFLLDANR